MVGRTLTLRRSNVLTVDYRVICTNVVMSPELLLTFTSRYKYFMVKPMERILPLLLLLFFVVEMTVQKFAVFKRVKKTN